ncbi:IclR family transcriptional regulator [Pseudarthrobacter sp. SSS035]|uniref:IclR family transcriptional regulator n=1 Tax=Pseudarthrobacter sp. SSS035 TaxID=2931399 RepID=UPI0021123D2E|nr:IclR family transcriptional regulator [Pseudarthrobacter sp. SSS035]
MQTQVSTDESTGTRTLRRGLSILSLFSVERPVLMQSEISRLLALPLPTVVRFCHTLVLDQYLKQDPITRELRLGPQILRLAGKPESGVTDFVRSWMRQLNEEFNEDVNLAILDGTHALYLDSIPSTRVLSTQTVVGSRIPAHSTAIGKSLLSQLDDQIIRDRLGPGPYEIRTEHTLHTWSELKASLDQIRESSISRSTDEYEPGLSGFAVPLRNEPGAPPLSLSIAIPTIRCTETTVRKVVDALLHPFVQ